MSQFPRLEYSMNDVRAAGIKLAGKVRFDAANYHDAVETFTVANSWRDSHIRPMQSVRASVRSHMRLAGIPGDMASRPKRMSSIRRKLAETTLRLDQMQDLGGCRAILNNIDGVNRVVERIRERSPVNGGAIPGHCGGVKAGHLREGAPKQRRRRVGIEDQGLLISPASASMMLVLAWFCFASAAEAIARRRPADCLRR